MSQNQNELLLIHAPFGRDAELIGGFMREARVLSSICPTIESLYSSINEGTGAVLMAQESLTAANVPPLAQIIQSQPPWSDLPLIITTTGGEANEVSRMRLRVMEPLGNVSLLERPLRVITLVSTVHMALRARRRQFQLRENFVERDRLVKELERSNEELSRFAHIVSHDLQAPVRMMNSFSELLARRYRGKLDVEGERFIQNIQDGASRMGELAEKLLHYASVGEEPISLATVELQSVMQDVLTTLQPTIDETGACITCAVLPLVQGDHLQLLQLFQNLIGNALKYGHSQEKLRITVACRKGDREFRISVRDNGPGIAPEHHETIFEPLRRLHGREISGTGMGLAVCRKIVERHRGKLWVESTRGQGSTFIFTLPRESEAFFSAAD